MDNSLETWKRFIYSCNNVLYLGGVPEDTEIEDAE
jgi:hypothetical protein